MAVKKHKTLAEIMDSYVMHPSMEKTRRKAFPEAVTRIIGEDEDTYPAERSDERTHDAYVRNHRRAEQRQRLEAEAELEASAS